MDKEQRPMAEFHISVYSAKDALWQGVLEHNGEQRPFKSEMQLLLLMMELVPGLRPEAAWQ